MPNRKPYTYLLKHIPSGKLYYGVRFAKNCHPNDFWKNYFTSSKYVKELILKDGKECWDYEIRKIFNCIQKARKWEEKVLIKINASYREDFLNKNNCLAPPLRKGKDCFWFGKHLSEEHKQKLSIANKEKSILLKQKIKYLIKILVENGIIIQN